MGTNGYAKSVLTMLRNLLYFFSYELCMSRFHKSNAQAFKCRISMILIKVRRLCLLFVVQRNPSEI